MAKFWINLDNIKGTALYQEASHDIKIMGGDLDYWVRGVVELSDDQAAYLATTYKDGHDAGIISPATGNEHLVRNAFKSNDSWQQ